MSSFPVVIPNMTLAPVEAGNAQMGDWNMRLTLSFRFGQQTNKEASTEKRINMPTLYDIARSSCEVKNRLSQERGSLY